MQTRMILSLVCSGLLAGVGTPARADDSAREQRLDARGDRIENRLDARGDRIDNRLDRKGDRINHRLDRRGERASRRRG